MITRFISSLEHSLNYVREHPQLFFVLMLMFVMPLLFLYSGQQFLDVARDNQDRLQKDKVGLLQDSFASLLFATNFDAKIAQTEIERLMSTNLDLIDFSIAKLTADSIVILAAKASSTQGTTVPLDDYYRNSTLRVDESIIFPRYDAEGRAWHVYRTLEPKVGEIYFIYTEVSLANIDQLFKQREKAALWSLIYVYAFIIALAYWHIRLTDYHFLYIRSLKQNQMKDLYTNMIAHELRAPLTAIRGYASMVGESDGGSERVLYAQRIRESSERLLGIVNDLLDVARIQSGKLRIELEAYDVTKVIEAVVREQQGMAKQKSIQLLANGITDPFELYTDPQRLHQALTNLVSNALKYTASGTVTLTLEPKLGQVEIRVKDTGMGISASDQRKLFAPFFRVDRDDVSNITGTGLGMWITRQLVELLGGTVTVESIRGVGTHVVVLLPTNPSETKKG